MVLSYKLSQLRLKRIFPVFLIDLEWFQHSSPCFHQVQRISPRFTDTDETGKDVDEYRDEWASNSTELKEKTPMFALVARHLVLKKKQRTEKVPGKYSEPLSLFESFSFFKRHPQKGLQMIGGKDG